MQKRLSVVWDDVQLLPSGLFHIAPLMLETVLRTHIPVKDVTAFLHDLTLIVSEEAGQDTAMRVLNRIVKAKADQVELLHKRRFG